MTTTTTTLTTPLPPLQPAQIVMLRKLVHRPQQKQKCDESYMDITPEAKMMINALLATTSKAGIARTMSYASNCGSQQINRMLSGRQKRMRIHGYLKLKKQYNHEIEHNLIKKPVQEE